MLQKKLTFHYFLGLHIMDIVLVLLSKQLSSEYELILELFFVFLLHLMMLMLHQNINNCPNTYGTRLIKYILCDFSEYFLACHGISNHLLISAKVQTCQIHHV